MTDEQMNAIINSVQWNAEVIIRSLRWSDQSTPAATQAQASAPEALRPTSAGLSTLRNVVETLQATGNYSDEEGEATNDLAGLASFLASDSSATFMGDGKWECNTGDIIALATALAEEAAPRLLQDETQTRDSKKLSQWFAGRPNARQEARDAATQGQANEHEPWLLYLSDRADGVKGHYAIARWNPEGYREVWNLRNHQWGSFSDEVLTLDEANVLLQSAVFTPVQPTAAREG